MIKQIKDYNLEILFINNIGDIESDKITLFRPRESFYTWKRSILAKLSPNMQVYKKRFSVKDFNSFKNVAYVNDKGNSNKRLDVESIAVIQSSNILPDIALGKKLGFKKFAVLPVPKELFKKCLVSHDQKLIFLPNFKVMYSTMNKLFSSFENGFTDSKKNSSIIDINDEKFKDYYKFTIVRNPIDRFLSLYYWSLKRDDLLVEYKESIETITEENYSLKVVLDIISKIPDSHSNNHWISQSYKLKLNPIRDIFAMNDIKGIVENLSNYTGREIDIPHENKSKNDPSKIDKLSVTELDILRYRYQDDFELYDSL